MICQTVIITLYICTRYASSPLYILSTFVGGHFVMAAQHILPLGILHACTILYASAFAFHFISSLFERCICARFFYDFHCPISVSSKKQRRSRTLHIDDGELLCSLIFILLDI